MEGSAKWFSFHFDFPLAIEHAVEMIHGAGFAKFVGTRNHPLVPERERGREGERERDFGDGKFDVVFECSNADTTPLTLEKVMETPGHSTNCCRTLQQL